MNSSTYAIRSLLNNIDCKTMEVEIVGDQLIDLKD